jgi:hypothetical protein
VDIACIDNNAKMADSLIFDEVLITLFFLQDTPNYGKILDKMSSEYL